jgi:hypothetical protein
MMQRFKIEISQRAYERLVGAAVSNRRNIAEHAAVMLTEALGLPFPEPRDAFDWPQQSDAAAPITDASELTPSA